jgi:hypothetical protein
MDRSTKQKINKETQTLNDTIDQLDLIDIYRSFHPILADAEAHLVTRAGRRLSVASNKMLQMMTAQMRAFK